MIVRKVDHAKWIRAHIPDQRAIILMWIQDYLNMTVVGKAVVFEYSVEQVRLTLR